MVRIVDMDDKITRYAVRRDVGHVILMIRLYQNEFWNQQSLMKVPNDTWRVVSWKGIPRVGIDYSK